MADYYPNQQGSQQWGQDPQQYPEQYGQDPQQYGQQQYRQQQYGQQQRPPSTRKPEVDGVRLWIAGVVTAVVAALANIVTLAISREILDVPVLIPASIGSDDLRQLSYALTALVSVVAALLATGLLHIFLKALPSPRTFFAWIVFLVWAASLIPPIMADVTTANTIVLLIMHTLLALIVGGTLSSVSRRVSTAV